MKLVVVVQRRLRNVQKSVIHVQNCYFSNLNMPKPRSFLPFSLRSPSWLPINTCREKRLEVAGTSALRVISFKFLLATVCQYLIKQSGQENLGHDHTG